MVTYQELTRRLGLPDHEQQAVLAWTGDLASVEYTEEEAARLIEIWHADTDRIEREASE